MRALYCLILIAPLMFLSRLASADDAYSQSCAAPAEIIIVEENDDFFVAEMDVEWEEDEDTGEVMESDDSDHKDKPSKHKIKKKDGDRNKKYKKQPKQKKSPKKRNKKAKCKMTCSKNRNWNAGPNAFK